MKKLWSVDIMSTRDPFVESIDERSFLSRSAICEAVQNRWFGVLAPYSVEHSRTKPVTTPAAVSIRDLVILNSTGDPVTITASEIRLDAHLDETRRQHRRRRQPRATRLERHVVARWRICVRRVIKVDPDLSPRPAESQDLRDSKIELVGTSA